MERALGARGARLLLAAGGTVAVTLSVPTALLEQIATASGLSEIVPLLAPPIGLGARIGLGAALALVPAAAVWMLWGSPAPAKYEPAHQADYLEIGDEDEMMQARKMASRSGWGTLIRLVRGGFHDNPEAHDELLARRRRDSHPDAPPRKPLFASRDLPPHEAAATAAAAGRNDRATEASVSRIADALAKAHPAEEIAEDIAMPRAPAPLSEAELALAVAAMPPPAAPRPAPSKLLQGLDLPLIEGANIADLAARFEHGLAKRAAIVHAEEARHRLAARLPLAQPDPSVRAALRAQPPVEVVTMPDFAAARPGDAESALRVDAEVETALNNALATLRKLTEQGRR